MFDDRPAAVTGITLLRRTAQRMVAELVDRLAEAGYPDLPAPYHSVFENLDPGGTRLTVLADRADQTHQAMGYLVGALEARGYVERCADPADGRARLVCLTPKGRQMVRIAINEIARIEMEWAGYWREAGLEGDLSTILRTGLRRDAERNRAL